MSQFLPAFEYLMADEDAGHTWKEITDNNGGGVIAGVNSASWPADFAKIAACPQAQREPLIQAFYLSRYWTPLLLGGITSQDVASRVQDMDVNAGNKEGAYCLQRAINSLRQGPVDVDGDIGPDTIEAANNCDPDSLLAAYREERVAAYTAIAAAKPQYAADLPGWLIRARK